MKKLITLLPLVLSPVFLSAQTTDPQNAVALVVGPNWFQPNNSDIDGGSEFSTGTGYSIGLEYAIDLSTHWQIKAGLRYNEYKYVQRFGPLTWPSEFSTGQYVYDPSLPHYLESTESLNALQYFAGIRWLGKPRRWRFYADFESGLTDFIEQPNERKSGTRFTLGAGIGLDWRPGPGHISVFAQPTSRYIFQDLGDDFSGGYSFLVPTIEVGLRTRF